MVIATCSVDYEGRLTAHLPLATRLLLVKADGSVLVHSDGGSYKPLNWMSPPCAMAEVAPDESEAADGVRAVWVVQHAKSEDRLRIRLHEVHHDAAHDLGVDPGLVKDGVESPPAAAARRAPRRPSATAGACRGASTRPPSGPSTCCVGTPTAGTSRSRSSAAARSTGSSS